MKKIALVTCRVLPEPDPDQDILLAALAKAGFEASMLAWDNPVADPAEHDLCVLRSTWDYYRHPGSFLKWIERADATSRLMNPGHVVRWNYHKRYLGELASAGVPVIPTAFFERGEEARLGAIMEKRKWDAVVVKPSISAGSFRTRRFTLAEKDAGQEFLRGLLKDRDVMVQEYQPSVEGEPGEKAVVWIDGEFTHAIRKSPRFADADENVSGALEISPEERVVAEQALASVRESVGPKSPLLYARVDVVRGPDGGPCVSEVELIEPSLFLLQHPPALARLVQAIENFSGEEVPPVKPADPDAARSKRATAGAAVKAADARKPFGRAPEPPTAADWQPKAPKSRYRKSRGETAGKWTPRDEKLKVWAPEGEEAKPWKPHEERRPDDKPDGEKTSEWKPRGAKPAGWKPRSGKPGDRGPRDRKPGEWKPRDRKPGEWKPRGEKSEGWKPRGGKPGEWKPRGEKSTGWKPRGEKPGEWKPRERKPGEWKPRSEKSEGWKPRGGKPGEWKPRGEKSTGWKPRGEKPGEWKPRERKPGEWKPRDKKPGEWKPRGEKPQGWKPRGGKPGEWKPRGPKPAGGKPGGRKFTGRKPPRRSP